MKIKNTWNHHLEFLFANLLRGPKFPNPTGEIADGSHGVGVGPLNSQWYRMVTNSPSKWPVDGSVRAQWSPSEIGVLKQGSFKMIGRLEKTSTWIISPTVLWGSTIQIKWLENKFPWNEMILNSEVSSVNYNIADFWAIMFATLWFIGWLWNTCTSLGHLNP